MSCFIFIFSSFTFAATNVDSLVDKYNFKVSADFRYLSYEEYDIGVELDGALYGVLGEFTYHGISNWDNHLMAGIDFEVLGGSLNYTGSTWGGTSLEEDSDDFLIETRGLIGYDYSMDNTKIITPFTGIGYRYWNNNIDGFGGYEREVQYLYAPIGIKTVGSLGNNWKGGSTTEFDLFLGGKVKSHLSDVNSKYNDPEVKQDTFNGYGFRVSIYFTREFKDRGYSLSFKPYMRYWDINESDKEPLIENGKLTGNYVVEPENTTLSYGLRLSLSF